MSESSETAGSRSDGDCKISPCILMCMDEALTALGLMIQPVPAVAGLTIQAYIQIHL